MLTASAFQGAPHVWGHKTDFQNANNKTWEERLPDELATAYAQSSEGRWHLGVTVILVLDLEEGTVQSGGGGSVEKGQRPRAFSRTDDVSMGIERGAHRTNTLRNGSLAW